MAAPIVEAVWVDKRGKWHWRKCRSYAEAQRFTDGSWYQGYNWLVPMQVLSPHEPLALNVNRDV